MLAASGVIVAGSILYRRSTNIEFAFKVLGWRRQIASMDLGTSGSSSSGAGSAAGGRVDARATTATRSHGGNPTTRTTTEPSPPPAGKILLCEDAEPQSPRDLTPTFVGGLEARVRPLDGDATPRFIQANLHFHLGAEHKSNITNGYFQSAEDVGLATPLVRPASSPDIRAGFFCGLDDVSSDDRDSYNFVHCNGVSVNYTYEFHWVFSSGAPLIGLRDEGPGR